MADVAGFAARKAEAAKRGKLRGIGYACYIEACGIAPSNVAGALGARAGLFEAGEVRVHPTGTRDGVHRLAQPRPGPRDDVRAGRRRPARHRRSRTSTSCTATPAAVLFGMGTYGSRSIAVGGTAIVKALDKIVAKGKKIAAHLLEAAEADIEFDRRRVQGRRAPTSRRRSARSRFAAYVPHNYPLDKLEPGLNENAFYDPTNFTFPAGTLHLRGRGRPRHRRDEDRQRSPPSTTSATSSTR